MNPETYLSDLEKNKIIAFNEDKVLKNAIYKVMLEPLYNHGVLRPEGIVDPTRNFALTQAFNMLLQKREMWDLEKLGAVNLANAMAIQMIEQGFGELEKFKNEPKSEKENEDESPQ